MVVEKSNLKAWFKDWPPPTITKSLIAGAQTSLTFSFYSLVHFTIACLLPSQHPHSSSPKLLLLQWLKLSGFCVLWTLSRRSFCEHSTSVENTFVVFHQPPVAREPLPSWQKPGSKLSTVGIFSCYGSCCLPYEPAAVFLPLEAPKWQMGPNAIGAPVSQVKRGDLKLPSRSPGLTWLGSSLLSSSKPQQYGGVIWSPHHSWLRLCYIHLHFII